MVKNVQIACPSCNNLMWVSIPDRTDVTYIRRGNYMSGSAKWSGKCPNCRHDVFVWAED